MVQPVFLYQTHIMKLGHVNFTSEIEETKSGNDTVGGRGREGRVPVGGESSC